MDDAKILHYATLAVPRYTSYPTAAEFVKVSDAQRQAWLSQLPEGEGVSLYIHIPYCRHICHYCGCHSKLAVRDNVIEAYGDTVVADILLQAKYLSHKPRALHLHWGGGTPSILPAASFKKIMAALQDTFIFDDNMEHAFELDPRSVTPQLVEILRDIGVNRASLGVQDVNSDVQKAIGRIQPIKTVARSVELLRGVGIEKINFDLIYGLPLQTEQTLKKTCDIVAQLKPDRVACYGYAHLPKRRANQKLIDASLLPGALERFHQAGIVHDCLLSHGYEDVGIDHYAKPDDALAQSAKAGQLNRNFQGYTDDNSAVMIGFGCSSISHFHQGFAQIEPDVGRYQKAIAEGRLATVRGIETDQDDRLRADLISELMCNFTIDLNQFGGEAYFAPSLDLLKPLIGDGLVGYKDGVVTMTAQGKPFVRAVAAVFDRYLLVSQGQFSTAV